MAEVPQPSIGATNYWSMPNLKVTSFNEMRRAVLKLAESDDVTAHYLMMEVLEEAFERGRASVQRPAVHGDAN